MITNLLAAAVLAAVLPVYPPCANPAADASAEALCPPLPALDAALAARLDDLLERTESRGHDLLVLDVIRNDSEPNPDAGEVQKAPHHGGCIQLPILYVDFVDEELEIYELPPEPVEDPEPGLDCWGGTIRV